MTVYGDGPEYERYMQEFMRRNPGPWKRCLKCGNWQMRKGERCSLCPPATRDAGHEHIRGSRDRRDWAEPESYKGKGKH